MAAGMVYGGTQLCVATSLARMAYKRIPSLLKATKTLNQTREITKTTIQHTTPIKQILDKSVKTSEKTVAKSAEKEVVKTEAYSLDQWSQAGQVLDREGLTKAGRALDKHGNRVNSPFPIATGNPASKNMQGQFHLDDISNPSAIKILS